MLTLIWSSYTSQSRTLDGKFPHQSRERATKFNSKMEEYLQGLDANVTVVEWIKLTANAQTSDGFHFLTDVNLFKGYYLLALAKLLKRQ